MFHFSTQNLILVGVFAHLMLALGKSVFKAPQQQAQLDHVSAKLDSVLSAAQQVLPIVQGLNRKSFSTPLAAISTVEELSLALHPLPVPGGTP